MIIKMGKNSQIYNYHSTAMNTSAVRRLINGIRSFIFHELTCGHAEKGGKREAFPLPGPGG
jgi:hypothetical protein